MRSHMDALQTMTPVALRRFLGDLHSVAKQASLDVALRSDFGGFGVDFWRLWEAKIDAKIDFGRFFCDAFFDRVSASILHGFSEARNLQKSLFFLRKINDFHEIDVFGKVSKNRSSWLRFRKPKR